MKIPSRFIDHDLGFIQPEGKRADDPKAAAGEFVAAFSEDQPRDDHGEWTAGADHQALEKQHTDKAGELRKQAAFEKNKAKAADALHQQAAAHRFAAQEHGIAHFIQEGRLTPKNKVEKDVAKKLRGASADLRGLAPAEIGGFAFDKTNPSAVQWIADHTAETIDGISATTRERIKDLVEQEFLGDFDADELTDRITELLGDPERAELIARTETMRASNEGQQEAWDQAVDAGLLTGNEQQEWIVTPDDRLCPVCEPMDGVTTDLDGTFDVDGDEIDGPPAHPRCRCTLGLKLGS